MHIDDLNEEQKVVITTYFYHEGIVNKLQSVIEKKVNQVDGSGRLVIAEEYLWEKEINKVKTKKGIFVFNDSELRTRRNQNEEYLLEDVSIILALNKNRVQTSFYVICLSLRITIC